MEDYYFNKNINDTGFKLCSMKEELRTLELVDRIYELSGLGKRCINSYLYKMY